MRQSHGLIPYIQLRAGGAPLYEQLYTGLRDAIRNGRLPPGTRLPATRTLAEDLNVARMTVTRAYDQLKAEGYVDAGVGSGTWVSEEIPDRLMRTADRSPRPTVRLAEVEVDQRRTLSERGRKLVDVATTVTRNGDSAPFTLDVPEVDHFPFRAWNALEKEVRQETDALRQSEPGGEPSLRRAVAHFIAGTRGGQVDEGQVVLTPGTKESVSLLAALLLDRGETVAMEEPGCTGARAIFEPLCEILSVPVDEEGMTVPKDEGDPPRLAFTTPSHQFPLGVTMSRKRRRELLEWAARTGAWIVEHDYDGEYRFTGRPLPSLTSLDEHGSVVYVGGFQKLMGPMFEAGFVILPPELVEPFITLLAVHTRRLKTLPQLMMARFIDQGHLARHVRTTREVFKARRDRLVEVLRTELGPDVELTALDAGSHIVAWLPEDVSAVEISRRLGEAGVKVHPVSRFAREPLDRDGLVLGYGGLDERRLASAAFEIALAVG